jgi:hypothetical protein
MPQGRLVKVSSRLLKQIAIYEVQIEQILEAICKKNFKLFFDLFEYLILFRIFDPAQVAKFRIRPLPVSSQA